MKYTSTKLLFILSFTLFIIGCNEDPERDLKLGQWDAQKGLIEEGILEGTSFLISLPHFEKKA